MEDCVVISTCVLCKKVGLGRCLSVISAENYNLYFLISTNTSNQLSPSRKTVNKFKQYKFDICFQYCFNGILLQFVLWQIRDLNNENDNLNQCWYVLVCCAIIICYFFFYIAKILFVLLITQYYILSCVYVSTKCLKNILVPNNQQNNFKTFYF